MIHKAYICQQKALTEWKWTEATLVCRFCGFPLLFCFLLVLFLLSGVEKKKTLTRNNMLNGNGREGQGWTLENSLDTKTKWENFVLYLNNTHLRRVVAYWETESKVLLTAGCKTAGIHPLGTDVCTKYHRNPSSSWKHCYDNYYEIDKVLTAWSLPRAPSAESPCDPSVSDPPPSSTSCRDKKQNLIAVQILKSSQVSL